MPDRIADNPGETEHKEQNIQTPAERDYFKRTPTTCVADPTRNRRLEKMDQRFEISTERTRQGEGREQQHKIIGKHLIF